MLETPHSPAAHTGEIAVGRRFGRLTIVRVVEAPGRATVIARCACGTEKTLRLKDLRSGAVKSCGCLRAEVAGAANRTHGRTKSPEHRAWMAMRARCNNPKVVSYRRYGGRGIRVCARWDSFANFMSDLGPKPSPDHSIDRIDVDGDYEPGNVRWATKREQVTNMRRTYRVLYQGKLVPLCELARLCGINARTFRNRIERGWSIDRALQTRRSS